MGKKPFTTRIDEEVLAVAQRLADIINGSVTSLIEIAVWITPRATVLRRRLAKPPSGRQRSGKSEFPSGKSQGRKGHHPPAIGWREAS